MIVVNIGDRFGNLTVISESNRNKQNKRQFNCQCDCGNTTISLIYDLVKSHTKSCGCLRKIAIKATKIKLTKHIINIGDVFERLTVLELNFKPGKRLVRCQCVCGNESNILVSNLVSGKVKSCGCYHKEIMASENPWLTEYNAYRDHCAIKRNLIWDLSLDFFTDIVRLKCIYCKSEPTTTTKVSNLKRNGIDRIDNNIGYIESNSVPCCKICNRAKNTLSKEDFLNWISQVYSISIEDN